MLGWIPWTLRMTYSDLLAGIPGTGTRKGGLAGPLLRCNLDAIVLLRFHALGLKLSTLATFLCTLVLLPMYWTSDCYDNVPTGGDNWRVACGGDVYNLTNYERTTLANVPSTAVNEDGSTVEDYGETFSRRAQIRLYFCTIAFGILQIYMIRLLKKEWIEILAMRRVYYLESNVWENRQSELNEIRDAAADEQAEYQEKIQSERLLFSSRLHEDEELMDSKRRQYVHDEMRRRVREPWIPDPEQRETIPNIQLYSLLVGGLPPLPPQTFEEDGKPGRETSGRESIDWQLRLTASFFDHCVPNQPGFSSSVAAVTVLPSSKSISKAWRRWYTAAKKLRRLRFIRAQLAYRLQQELEEHEHEHPSHHHNNNSEHQLSSYYHQPDIIVDDSAVVNVDTIQEEEEKDEVDILFSGIGPSKSSDNALGANQPPVPGRGKSSRLPTPSSVATSIGAAPDKGPNDSDNTYHEQLRDYYETVLREQEHDVVIPVQASSKDVGSSGKPSPKHQDIDISFPETQHDENDDDDDLSETEQDLHALLINRFGPEQTAVYSREFAQSAAPCCPNGCNERKIINNTNIEELKLLEQEAAEAVLHANQELWLEQQRARQAHTLQITKNTDDDDVDEAQEEVVEPGVRASGEDEPEPEEQKRMGPLRSRFAKRRTELPSNYNLEGKILRDQARRRGSFKEVSFDADDSSLDEKRAVQLTQRSNLSNIPSSFMEPLDSLDALESGVSMTSREPPSPWSKVEHITKAMMAEAAIDKDAKQGKLPRLERKSRRSIQVTTGKWSWPRVQDIFGRTKEKVWDATGYITNQTLDYVDLTNESTYAVVTFTSRQAAIAARHCLADGRAYAEDRWKRITEVPIPPLADSAAWDFCVCRNCCRPVTLTIDDRQKQWRHYCVLVALLAFYTLMVFPISFVAQLLNPQNIRDIAPELYDWMEERRAGITETISGFLQSLVWTVFFALCPTFFKIMANFGSLSTSLANAELRALQYYWWFMAIVAFSGTFVSNMIITAANSGNFAGELRQTLAEIGRSIPSTVAASWLNWIVLRTTFTMTSNYLLRFNSYLFACLGWKCCSRLDRGGGPGPPVPYRLYVDSSVVLMAVVGLAPASPLVAPAAMLYFLWCQPILRRGCIFVYRPRFDGGGFRYPFIFLMAISGLIIGQILLTIQMALKQAVGPTILASIPILFTLLSYRGLKRKYEEPFLDAALLQTSLLDGWDAEQESSVEKREDFRKFLVDSHKAAYVPVCLAGSDAPETSLTAEPAVVVPLETDLADELLDSGLGTGSSGNLRDLKQSTTTDGSSSTMMIDAGLQRHKSQVLKRRKMQHGATMRRAAKNVDGMTSNNASSKKSGGRAVRKKMGPPRYAKEEDKGHDL